MKIKDIGNVVTGKTPQTAHAEFYDGDYMFITPTELHGGYKISSSGKTLTEAGIESIKSNSIDGISVLVGCIGWDMGNVAMCFEKCATNQQINSVTQISENYNPYFLYYWLSTKKEYLFSISSVTRTPILSKGTFEEIEIPNISRSKQDKIAKALSALDKKIELNSETNDNLAQQLRLLYDYWFTQFDFPDENGKPYRSSGGQMVWNDDLKRHIPNFWECDNLYRIADYVNGLACQKHRPVNGEEALPVIKIKEMHDGITADTELVSANIPSKNIVQPGDILFSWSASLEIAFWFGCTAGLNQHIFKVIPKAPFSREYVYLQLSEYIVQFVRIAESRKTTMGHITSDHLNESRVVIPPIEVIQKFTTIARPIFEELKVCHAEMEHLQNLRDWLLPMLMNGQATISD